MFCPHCGKEIAEHQAFCQFCGGSTAAVSPSQRSGRAKTAWEEEGTQWTFGGLASTFGLPETLVIFSLITGMAAIWFLFSLKALRRVVHPIYRTKGILPPIRKAPILVE